MTRQFRAQDPTGQNPNGIFVTPERDLAHVMPILLTKTANCVLDVVSHYGEAEAMSYGAKDREELTSWVLEHCSAWRQFIDSVQVTGPGDGNAALRDAGVVSSVPKPVQELFGRWFLRVVAVFYYTAFKEAMHPGETPLYTRAFADMHEQNLKQHGVEIAQKEEPKP